jgi:hypothetical protein
MADNESHVTDAFGPEAVSRLQGALVRVAPGRQVDLRTLLGAWDRHVDKIEGDLDLPDSDRSVWGAHDLLAALSLRTFIEQGIGELDREVYFVYRE